MTSIIKTSTISLEQKSKETNNLGSSLLRLLAWLLVIRGAHLLATLALFLLGCRTEPGASLTTNCALSLAFAADSFHGKIVKTDFAMLLTILGFDITRNTGGIAA
jgi:hypothetical protein